MGVSAMVGVISGIGAVVFYQALTWATDFFLGSLAGFDHLKPGMDPGTYQGWAPPESLIFIIPLICGGALLSGCIAWRFAPEVMGAGNDAAICAFHHEGRVRARVPLLKAVTALLTIATGGSAGREGPVAQISAGFGSILADLLKLSPRYRRIALVAGIGAGVGAIFKAPLGGAILAAEMLYIQDFETEAIIPAFLASIVSYSIFGMVEGFAPLFGEVEFLRTVTQLPLYILLGLIAALVGFLFIRSYTGTGRVMRAAFERHGIPGYLAPLLGAFMTGILVVALAFTSPEGEMIGVFSLGSGYGVIQMELYQMLPLAVLILLPFAKIVTTSLTIGSGGSGGVFAPGLLIGGSCGGAVGTVLHLVVPSLVPTASIPVFVVLGMISLFGSVANAPLAVMIMVIEMTNDFSLLVPAMGAVAAATVISGDRTIFREQVSTKASSPAHRGEYMVKILTEITVRRAMVPRHRVIALSPDDPVEAVIHQIEKTGHTGYPVIADDQLVGVVTIRDVREAEEEIRVSEVMSPSVISITADMTLEDALRIMITHDIDHLPVVIDDEERRSLVGFLTRTDIMQAYVRWMSRLR